MKTPIDNGSVGATLALLNGGTDFQMLDLYAITLNGGQVIYMHGGMFADSVTFKGNTYTGGWSIDRGKVSTKLGVEVSTLDITFNTNAGDLINGHPITPFAQGRGFDGATVVLYRAYLASWARPYSIVGATISFSGRVTQMKSVSRIGFTMAVASWTVLLNADMGPDVFQSGCLNTHYDANCGLNKASYAVSGTVTGSPSTTAWSSNLTYPDGYFSKGQVVFTSGANAGVSRTCQASTNASGNMFFAFPWPVAPSAGDGFTAYRGCLLTMADCTAQGNLGNFRGQPFVPPAISGAIG